MTAYYSDYELQKYESVKDKELNELFQEIREKFGPRYYLHEMEWLVKKWLRKDIKTTMYTLLIDLDGKGQSREVHVFNFPTSNLWSICDAVPKAQVMTLFLGMVNGLAHAEQKEKTVTV